LSDEENQNSNDKGGSNGRTWADVFVGATYITGGGLFLLAMGIGIYFLVGEVPVWFFIAMLTSLIFVPFMIERAKDDASLMRQVLSSIDVQNKTAIGSEFANHTQIDQVRDLTTLQRMVEMLQSTLKETRISSQTVGQMEFDETIEDMADDFE